jgi:phosphate transport system substrate-binding protein
MPADYRCQNLGNCKKADRKEVIHLPEGVDPACPECGAQLTLAKPLAHTVSCIVVSVLLLLGGALLFYGIKSLLEPHSPSAPPATAPTTPLVAETPTPTASLAATTPATTTLIAKTPDRTTPLIATTPVATVVLRIHGSNTIGSKLVPSLTDEFLKQQGATGMRIVTGKNADESEVEATFPGESSPKRVEIFAHGSATAFADLQTDKCDIGMASRQIKADEAKSCEVAGLGDMYSPASEHVLGLDGIAVIVNQANPLNALTKSQIAAIFSGKVSDWSQVGGTPSHINLYARDAESGTFDTFKALVLTKGELSGEAKRFEDSRQLSAAVARDPAAIGFVGLPFIDESKALAVSEAGSVPLLPTRFTVATEDYPLARRLYLYAPANPQNPLVRKFVEFALGKEGQQIVNKSGFVGQRPMVARSVLSPDAPAQYLMEVRDADRVDFRVSLPHRQQ